MGTGPLLRTLDVSGAADPAQRVLERLELGVHGVEVRLARLGGARLYAEVCARLRLRANVRAVLLRDVMSELHCVRVMSE